MSNPLDYDVQVLAGSPAEINQIAARLNQPSVELANWIAQRSGEPVRAVEERLKELLEFKTVQNLGYVHQDVNKARLFRLASTDRHRGIVDSHLIEVSEGFPKAIFLVEYYDMQWSYSGKRVMRAGEVVKEVFDGQQPAQAVDWALPDIFAPFNAEYYGEQHEFGSLWASWLEAMVKALKGLQENR